MSSCLPSPFNHQYERPVFVQQSLEWLSARMRESSPMDSPALVRDYLRLWLADRPHEVFAVIFLDSQHHVIEASVLFRGSLSQTSVYPREIAVEALHRHAAAVIAAHNHPSGSPEPSHADIALTRQLKSALNLIDVRLVDHFVVTRATTVSFAERGLL